MFENPQKFSLFIEEKANKSQLSYLEAILEYCNDNDIEPEDLKNMLSKTLIDKLKQDFREIGLLPKVSALDI